MNYYYPKTLEGIQVAIGDIFCDIKTHIYTSAGEDTGRTKDVNIMFGPVDGTYLKRVDQGEAIRYYTQNPKIGILLRDIKFAQNRAMGQNEFLYAYNPTSAFHDLASFIEYVQPTPYNFNFQLQIRADNMSDMAQVVENILPHFYPQNSIRVREFVNVNVSRNLKVILDGCDFDFVEVMDQTERREIKCNIGVTVEGVMYRPISTEGIIKHIKSSYFINHFSSEITSASSFDISGATSTYSALTSFYLTSGVEGHMTSAFPPGNRYDFSGVNDSDDTDIYWFTSAVGIK